VARPTHQPAEPAALQRPGDRARAFLARLASLSPAAQRALAGRDPEPDETQRPRDRPALPVSIPLDGAHRQPQVHLQVADLDPGALSPELPGRPNPAIGPARSDTAHPWRAGLGGPIRSRSSPAGDLYPHAPAHSRRHGTPPVFDSYASVSRDVPGVPGAGSAAGGG